MISKAVIVTELFNLGASETETDLKIIENGVERNLTAEELAQVNTEYDAQIASFNNKQYQRDRADAYPSIGDQLDALFHAGVFPEEMAAQIQAVKDAHPKPTTEGA
jgi:hypothetical protein